MRYGCWLVCIFREGGQKYAGLIHGRPARLVHMLHKVPDKSSSSITMLLSLSLSIKPIARDHQVAANVLENSADASSSASSQADCLQGKR